MGDPKLEKNTATKGIMKMKPSDEDALILIVIPNRQKMMKGLPRYYIG
jgi:hypothetical protein